MYSSAQRAARAPPHPIPTSTVASMMVKAVGVPSTYRRRNLNQITSSANTAKPDMAIVSTHRRDTMRLDVHSVGVIGSKRLASKNAPRAAIRSKLPATKAEVWTPKCCTSNVSEQRAPSIPPKVLTPYRTPRTQPNSELRVERARVSSGGVEPHCCGRYEKKHK